MPCMLDKDKNYYCFFNGDADGVFSALQFILSGFTIKLFFTGHKRDQSLLRHGEKLQNKNILVLDLEIAKNINSLKKVLDHKCYVTWFDHHGNGEESIFLKDKNFFPIINTIHDINTSLLVYNFFKEEKLLIWAIIGLFGDNIESTAQCYCQHLNLSSEEITVLREIGRLINYNSYGVSLSDLIVNPIHLIEEIRFFSDPISFYKSSDIIVNLKRSSLEDLELGFSCYKNNNIVFLPNLPWARRVHGILANFLANKDKTKPLAVLVDIDEDNYLVSVRAPLNQPLGAGDLCRLFHSGGGRASAGGINRLHKNYFEKFKEAFSKKWAVGLGQ